jgi:hypothetical protein
MYYILKELNSPKHNSQKTKLESLYATSVYKGDQNSFNFKKPITGAK